MFVQVGVWGSKRLAQYLMERSYPNNWLIDVDDDTKRTIERLHPVAIKSNFQEQYGSIMPKLLRYYDIQQGSDLAKQSRLDLKPYRAWMDEKLAPYMDEDIGLGCRSADHDNIQVYPYLIHESSDYFTTHNIYSEYACEDFLRLVHRQLQNYCSSECYMTQIRAYNPDFDTCYQSISVKNPGALKDRVSEEPLEIKQSWLGQHQYGYAVHELERELGEGSLEGTSFRDSGAIISPTEMNKLILAGTVDRQIISDMQLHHKIFWHEAFDPNHVSFMYDLLGIRARQSFYITHSNQVQYLDFDWDSLV